MKKSKKEILLLSIGTGVILVLLVLAIWWNYVYNPIARYTEQDIQDTTTALYESCLTKKEYSVVHEYYCKCFSDSVSKKLRSRNYRKRDMYDLLKAADTVCNRKMRLSDMPEEDLVAIFERNCMEDIEPSEAFCHCLATNQVKLARQYDNDVAIKANMTKITVKSLEICAPSYKK